MYIHTHIHTRTKAAPEPVWRGMYTEHTRLFCTQSNAVRSNTYWTILYRENILLCACLLICSVPNYELYRYTLQYSGTLQTYQATCPIFWPKAYYSHVRLHQWENSFSSNNAIHKQSTRNSVAEWSLHSSSQMWLLFRTAWTQSRTP